MSTLENEIEMHKKEIHSDAYPMSIGEAVSLYQNGELDIHPEFQRVFRWDNSKKSKFIESILLGIPIPSFFVSQRDDGVWDMVDGLQRFSTILSFMGELRDEEGNIIEPLVLESGDYLESLAGVKWSDEEKFTKSMKLSFRREKIDFKIIKKESTSDTKYELFKRINTGGLPLSDQEVRNCILIMINREFYEQLENLAKNYEFMNAVSISEDKLLEQYHVELVVRFLVFYHLIHESGGTNGNVKIDNLTEFLDKNIVEIAQLSNFSLLFDIFTRTFTLINSIMGENSFRKFYAHENRHKGGFSIALYEALSIGIANNINRFRDIHHLEDLIKEFSGDEYFTSSSGAGIRAGARVIKTIPYAIRYFRER